MAYVQQPIQEKQLEDLTQTGQGSVTTQTGSADTSTAPATNGNASNLTQATSTPGTTPSQFVNFGDLVNANEIATNDYSKNVGNLIGLGDTSNTLNAGQTAANTQVNTGYTDVGQDTIDHALSSPTDTSYDGYNTLKSILGGQGYTGPTSASDVYTGAKSALDTLGGKSGALMDPTALQQFILAKPNAGTTAGGAQLDAALLTGTQGAQQQIADVQKQVGDLQNQYTADVADTQSQINAKTAAAAARKNDILGQANSTLSGIASAGQAQADAQNAAESARVAAAKDAASRGDFATLGSLIPGLDASSLAGVVGQLSDKSGDYSSYLTTGGPSYTNGNYVSDADKARYAGIQQLFGIKAPQIALAGNGATTQFNTGSALGALQSRLSSQRVAEAASAAAAQQQAQQQAAAQLAQQQAALFALLSGQSAGSMLSGTVGNETGNGGPGTAGTGGAGSTATGQTSPSAAASAIGNVASAVTGVPGISQGIGCLRK
jgi:hypothetical protein